MLQMCKISCHRVWNVIANKRTAGFEFQSALAFASRRKEKKIKTEVGDNRWVEKDATLKHHHQPGERRTSRRTVNELPEQVFVCRLSFYERNEKCFRLMLEVSSEGLPLPILLLLFFLFFPSFFFARLSRPSYHKNRNKQKKKNRHSKVKRYAVGRSSSFSIVVLCNFSFFSFFFFWKKPVRPIHKRRRKSCDEQSSSLCHWADKKRRSEHNRISTASAN